MSAIIAVPDWIAATQVRTKGEPVSARSLAYYGVDLAPRPDETKVAATPPPAPAKRKLEPTQAPAAGQLGLF